MKARRHPRLWTLGLSSCAVLAVIGWNAGQSSVVSAQSSEKAPVKSGPSEKVVSEATEQGYQESEFPNVMVRSVPQSVETKAAGKTPDGGWIYVKPGARLTPEDTAALARSRRAPGVGTRITRGRSAAGGRVLYLDPSRMPLAQAQKNAQGKMVLQCNDKTHKHQGPHSHMAHETTTRKAVKVAR
jgi:hypothetical protein